MRIVLVILTGLMVILGCEEEFDTTETGQPEVGIYSAATPSQDGVYFNVIEENGSLWINNLTIVPNSQWAKDNSFTGTIKAEANIPITRNDKDYPVFVWNLTGNTIVNLDGRFRGHSAVSGNLAILFATAPIIETKFTGEKNNF
jgi:hypothetical protein